jgi:hypothetical protein
MQAIGADANDWDKCFKLMADIDLSAFTGTQFNIIGIDYDNPFTGVFDGNGHAILNFSFTSTGRDYIGLFGHVSDPNAEIKDLRLIDPNVDAGTGWHFGSLVGCLEHGTIIGCCVYGGSISGEFDVGGLVGDNGGFITGSSSSASVSGFNHVGGLVGFNNGIISHCHSSGAVSGGGPIGGLVGANSRLIFDSYSTGRVSGDQGVGGLAGANDGTITNCYSSANVSGAVVVAGLVGFNDSIITKCYAVGTTYGSGLVGGLVAHNNGGVGADSFWDIETTGQATSAGGTEKTTAQMQTKNTFTSAGWDFVGEVINGPNDIWTICEGEDYPRLWWEKYGGGNGTGANPYLIRTSCQMNAIGADSNDWDKHFLLCADIDLAGFTGTEFNIIGKYVGWHSPDNKPFTGVFDGNGHTISNFSYTATDESYAGLFEDVNGPNAEIKNLGLIDPNINGRQFGSLVVYLERGTLTGCSVDGGSISLGSGGGLVGVNRGTISDCSVSTNIYGDMIVGGLVGQNWDGTISNCYSNGTVSGISQIGGGLVGANGGTIINCHSSAAVSGLLVIGGLVGSNGGTITNCYSTGSVSGMDHIGGLVGYGGAAANSFWDIQTSGQSTSVGGTGLPTAEMQMQVTFTDAGWDFSTPVWKMNCETMSYPKLSWWLPVPGDYGCPDGVDFVDYSFFAAHWAEDNCSASNDCDGTDLDLLETVDINDLRIFVDNWLRGF